MENHASMQNKLPVIFLMGTTATGKTDLAAKLFAQGGYELVSVDAAQIFRDMNIGTAKPDEAFLKQFPHHLINVRSPLQSYSAAEFCNDVNSLIMDIHNRGLIPILVGGTMFYFHAFENGLSELPAANPEVRKQIADQLQKHGLPRLYEWLTELDFKFSQTIKPTDSQRIQRALELALSTNQKPSDLMMNSKPSGTHYPLIKLALFLPDRNKLHEQIEIRFRQMLDHGLLGELSQLIEQYSGIKNAPSMRTVGYRQPLEYLNGDIDYEQMIEKGVAATRQLAKRQLTWMRQQSNLVWVQADHAQSYAAVNRYLESTLG